MNILIIGGGKLAFYLIEMLSKENHQISVVEQHRDVSQRLASYFENIRVFHGDGTDIDILTHAGCAHADIFLAVTGKDENNLVGCQIAKKNFNVQKIIARVNNPKNTNMFFQVGVNQVYSSTQIIADIIEEDIIYDGMRLAYSIKGTEVNIVEVVVSPKSKVVHKSLAESTFPGTARVVLLTHQNGDIETPTGTSVVQENDRLLLTCHEKDYKQIYAQIVNP